MVQAVLARANIALDKTGPVRADSSNPYRGRKLLSTGRNEPDPQQASSTDGMDQRAIVAAAFTQGTGDFPILLENVMHKTLLGAYALQADTWTLFCARGTVSDFRAHNRYRVGSLSNLESKNELGEFATKPSPMAKKPASPPPPRATSSTSAAKPSSMTTWALSPAWHPAWAAQPNARLKADVYATLALNSGWGQRWPMALPCSMPITATCPPAHPLSPRSRRPAWS
jgi:hypothetical protein